MKKISMLIFTFILCFGVTTIVNAYYSLNKSYAIDLNQGTSKTSAKYTVDGVNVSNDVKASSFSPSGSSTQVDLSIKKCGFLGVCGAYNTLRVYVNTTNATFGANWYNVGPGEYIFRQKAAAGSIKGTAYMYDF